MQGGRVDYWMLKGASRVSGCAPDARSERVEWGHALGVCDDDISCLQLASGGGRDGLRRRFQEGACCGSTRAVDNGQSKDMHAS